MQIQNCFPSTGCIDCVWKVLLRIKGLKPSHTGRFKHKSSPEGRQLKSKQQENLALLATTNTDVYELLPLQCGLFHEMLLSISMSSTATQF